MYNMKSKHAYRKLICSLVKYKGIIGSQEDLNGIENLGKKTRELIIKSIFCEKSTKTEASVSSKLVTNKSVQCLKEATQTDQKNNTSSQKTTKKYIPSYKSGAYAILKVLFKEDGTSKKLICHKGNKYSTTEFSTSSRLSAWCAIKTLIHKELVYKDNKRYYLTENGKNLCKELFYDESTIVLNNEMHLVIDSREMKSRRERSFFQTYFDTAEVQYITKNIELGDFIWTCGDDVLNFIVERKKGSDFCSSITDGRMKNQKQRLLNSGIDNIYYIVENLKESDMNRIGKNYAYACLNGLKNEMITVIETDNITETADVVKILDERVKTDMYISSITFEVPKTVSLDDYIDKGTKNKSLTTGNIFMITLCTVKGLNTINARAIADKYLTYANFIRASRTVDFIDVVANIDVLGQKIGYRLASKVHSSLCS